MTTGELLVARAAMKPLATLNRPTLEDRRRRHQGGGGVASRSAPTSPPCRRWASSPRRWWRWCSPPRRSASSAATPSASSSATRRRSSATLADDRRRDPRTMVLVGLMGAGKTTVGPPASASASAGPCSTDDQVIERAPVARCARSSPATASRRSAPWRPRPWSMRSRAPVPSVIAAAGGVVLERREPRPLLEAGNARVVWLRADPRRCSRACGGRWASSAAGRRSRRYACSA